MPYIRFRDYHRKKYKCSVRLLRICQDNRLRRLSDFTKMSLNEVLALPECGNTTALSIKTILNDNGLDFRDSPSNKRRRRIATITAHEDRTRPGKRW